MCQQITNVTEYNAALAELAELDAQLDITEDAFEADKLEDEITEIEEEMERFLVDGMEQETEQYEPSEADIKEAQAGNED